MKLKPSQQEQERKTVLDGIGNTIAAKDAKNPWMTLAKGTMPRGPKRRRPFADNLGATPVRDGPFAEAARAVASQSPPKTRQQRTADATLGELLPRVRRSKR